MSLTQNYITRIVARETDPINQARILMLFYLIIAYTFFSLCLIFAYAYNHQDLQLTRASIIFCFAVMLLAAMYFANIWKLVAHTILILLTVLGVWGNLMIFVHGVNVATLQYIWLASALGFYMLGSKWGWFYAVVNIMPVLIDGAFTDKSYLFLNSLPQGITKPVYLFVITFDFFLIIFLHYFFFKSFKRNFIKLNDIKNELNGANKKLNRTLHEVEQLSNARMNFLSTMSHELRTPLNGVIGLTNALLSQDPRKDQEETLSILKFSAENLLTLVNDILDFNKLDSEKVELENTPFNLAWLVENIYASTKIRALEKQLDFKLEIAEGLKDKRLYGDPTRLTQVLLNLLNNAIKFTEKGFVKLSCVNLEQSNNQVKVGFIIEDTGIGIEESRQKSVFEAFAQASASINRNYGGTGLGLSIVKKVLDLYDSSIQLQSSLGKGTTFSFDITYPFETMALDDNDNSLQRGLSKSDLSALKILVVEDNAINILVMRKTLNKHHIEPDVAENGKIALDMLTRNHYDVILMDLHMPEMGGYEATQLIRALADPVKANVPIIALTATVSNQVIEEVLGVGMNGYLSKPFHPQDLFAALQKFMEE